MKSRIVLGSRGSLLALAQVKLTREALQRAHPGLEIEAKIITTSGDRRQEVKAGEGSAAGLKGLFTKEIQDTMLEGEIDAAVHSLKDLPGVTPAELELGAVLPRERTSDLLISKSYAGLDALPAGGRVGTGSVRRRRQLQWLAGAGDCGIARECADAAGEADEAGAGRDSAGEGGAGAAGVPD